MGKKLIVVGGPNGAGKTTFAMDYRQLVGIRYLAADDIAARLRPGAPEETKIEAGKTFSRELSSAIEADESLLVESTLSGTTFLRPLTRAREAGYQTQILFVTLQSPEVCIQRVRERVRRGGHHVPAQDVRRRYFRSRRNFWDVYRFEVDSWQLYLNSQEGFLGVALGEKDSEKVGNEALFDQFLRTLTESQDEI